MDKWGKLKNELMDWLTNIQKLQYGFYGNEVEWYEAKESMLESVIDRMIEIEHIFICPNCGSECLTGCETTQCWKCDYKFNVR